MAQNLPTWTQIADNAMEELSRSRNAASEAASWLRSDWDPVGTALTPEAGEARYAALNRIGQIKDLIDECQGELHRVRAVQPK